MTAPFTVNAVGKIRLVHCKNFVTYDECTFHPTEYLNVIIGPNGTGKSTLVSAVVLCLGGETITLHRARDIKDYIKNGYEEAQITVEICANNSGDNVAFTRSFNESNKSQYYINQEAVTRKKYFEKIALYNIQVTNLCQFLPQDRVQDFAKMNAQEILKNTINSVCNQEVQEQFAKLKELQSDKENRQKSLAKDKEKLKECLNRINELRAKIDVLNKRKEYEEKVKICNAKRLWMEVDHYDEEIKQQENDLVLAEENYKKWKNKYESFTKSERQIKQITESLQAEIAMSNGLLEKYSGDIGLIGKEIEELTQKLQQLKANFEKDKLDLRESQKELENETRLLEVCIQDLTDAKAKDAEENNSEKLNDLKTKLQVMKSASEKFVDARMSINRELDTLMPQLEICRRRLKQMENIDAQKLKFLEEKFPDVYAAILWLRSNRNLFEGHVYNPLMMELNVKDANCAKYLENAVPMRDFLSFTCEQKNDVSLLIDELCVKKKLAINVGHAAPAEHCIYEPNMPIEEIRKFGFTGYLIEMISGPPALLNYLCSLHGLHRIPYGGSEVGDNTDNIPTSIRVYFGYDQRYNVAVSKYTKEASVMQVPIASKHFLHSVDLNEQQRIKQEYDGLIKRSDQLKNSRTRVESKIDEAQVTYNEFKSKINVLEAKNNRITQLEQQCKRQEQKILRLKNQLVSLPDLENKFMATCKQNIDKIISLQEKKLKILQKYPETLAKKQRSSATMQVYAQENAGIASNISEVRDTLQHHEKLRNAVLNSCEKLKRNMAERLEEALRSTNNRRPNERNFPYHKEFKEIPDDIDELKDFLNEHVARLECMVDVNADIVNEYESKVANAESSKAMIKDMEEKQNNCDSEMNEVFAQWYEEINRIVELLRKNFSDFMQSMNYVGDIVLFHKDQYDFESYGIQIMVQYRTDEALHALDRTRQSGGERAVAIAVYSLSMQHISHVPFRCVDEINQGMDSKNERRIFEMLVKETTKTGGSQYFFVTPKLLPNLAHNERMSVHIVFNGKKVEKDAFQVI